MNFGGSRLGFWFVPLGPPRQNFSKKVLVFYDNYTNGPEGQTDYYNTSGDVNPGTDVWPTIRDREIALGNEPQLVVGYTNLGNLNQYAHVWDIGYASPYTSNPTYNPTNQLTAYLQFGGSMFLLGENANFGVRDDTIDVFVTQAGGGSIARSGTDYNFSVAATVEPEFRLVNNNPTVTFNRPGTFTAYGTGTPMSTAFTGTQYVAVCWKTGSLANAGRGAVVSILDINFLVPAGDLQPDFIDNVIATLNQK